MEPRFAEVLLLLMSRTKADDYLLCNRDEIQFQNVQAIDIQAEIGFACYLFYMLPGNNILLTLSYAFGRLVGQ